VDPKASNALMKFLSQVANRLGVGKHIYVVGGAVRNFVLGVPIKDIDVVIDSVALRGKDSEWFAKQVAKAIPAKTNLVTNQYGVALLHVVGDWTLDGSSLKGEDIEIANARKESYGEGGYKPDKVVPATIEEDTLRREFSFNTLLWKLKDLASGPDRAPIIDLTGCGLRDLQQGVMRCPRDPDTVFSDDPSRLIRAVKFTIKYGFKIPPDLEKAIKRNAQKLWRVPSSHLSNMLINVFLREPTGKKALLEMKRLGLLDVIKDIAKKDKSFRQALGNWAQSEAKVQFLFDLMDLGLPVGNKLRFLRPEHTERVRDLTVNMTPAEADTFIDILKNPGKVFNMPKLIQEFGLEGRDIQVITLAAQEAILADPALAASGPRLEEKVRQALRSKRVAAKWLARQ